MAPVLNDTRTNPYTLVLIQTGVKKVFKLTDIQKGPNGNYLALVTMTCEDQENLFYIGCRDCYTAKNSAIPVEQCDCFSCKKKTILAPRYTTEAFIINTRITYKYMKQLS